MVNQYLQYTNAAPFIRMVAFDITTGERVTTLTHVNTQFTTTRGLSDTVHTGMAAGTLGTWASNTFVHRGNGVYDWYCPVSVNAAGVDRVDVRASTLPANVEIVPFVVTLGPDALTTPALSDSGIATAVEGALVDNFAAIPGAVVTAMRTEVTLSAWGVTSQPSGGLTRNYPERRNGTVIGTRTAFFDSANVCVGMTAVV